MGTTSKRFVTGRSRTGFVLVGQDSYPLSEGERIRWPAHVTHRLWTESDEMTTLMIEHGSWQTPLEGHS
jgi:hypothetical protein